VTKNKIVYEDLKTIVSHKIGWERFRNKTVLISGANGFLPAYMVEVLLYLNEIDLDFNTRIIALVRSSEKATSRFADYLGSNSIQFLVQDVSDEIEVYEKIDFIIHAASQASPKYYGIDPVGTLSANILGTINLIKLAQRNEVEAFLYFSSGEVYGQVADEFVPIAEDTFGYLNPTSVRSCYAESKRMGENICISWFHQYNVQAKIVRPFHTYGPKMLLNDGRVYADFVANVLDGKNIRMKSDGSAKRAFCYLTDATAGFFTILLNGVAGEAYNVGNPYQEYSILNLAKTLTSMFPEKHVNVIEVEEQDDNAYLKSPITRNTPDIQKIQKLGWSPKVAVEDGFRRTIESYSY
jgi:UDP-glucuronate decarboxylase